MSYPKRTSQTAKTPVKKANNKVKDDNCTFTPTINDESRRISRTGGKSRFEQLYDEALARKEKEKRLEEVKNADVDNTGVPHINDSNYERKKTLMQRYKEQFDADEEKRQQVKKKFEESRELRRKEVLEEECTFQPNINELEGGSKKKHNGKVYKRLYKESKKRKVRHEKAAKEREEQIIKSKPDVTELGSHAQPRYLNIPTPQEKEKKRQELLKQLQPTDQKEGTFKPQINPKSEEILQQKKQQQEEEEEQNLEEEGDEEKEKEKEKKSVFLSLYKRGLESEKKKKEQIKKEEQKRKSVKPQINKDETYANKKTEYNDFLTRTQQDLEKRKYKERQMKQMKEERERGPKSKKMTPEEKKSFLERQAEAEAIKQRKLRDMADKKNQDELCEVTGKPRINKVKIEVQNHKVYDRLYHYEYDTTTKMRVENDLMKECTFTPAINKYRRRSYAPTSSGYGSTKSSPKLRNSMYSSTLPPNTVMNQRKSSLTVTKNPETNTILVTETRADPGYYNLYESSHPSSNQNDSFGSKSLPPVHENNYNSSDEEIQISNHHHSRNSSSISNSSRSRSNSVGSRSRSNSMMSRSQSGSRSNSDGSRSRSVSRSSSESYKNNERNEEEVGEGIENLDI